MWKFNNFLNNFTWKANLGFHPCLKPASRVHQSSPELLSKSVKKFRNLTFYSLHFLQEMHWAKILHRRKPAYFLLFTYLQDAALDVYNSIFATTSNSTLNHSIYQLYEIWSPCLSITTWNMVFNSFRDDNTLNISWISCLSGCSEVFKQVFSNLGWRGMDQRQTWQQLTKFYKCYAGENMKLSDFLKLCGHKFKTRVSLDKDKI